MKYRVAGKLVGVGTVYARGRWAARFINGAT